MPILSRPNRSLKEYFNRVSVIVITGGSSGIGSALIKAILNVREDLVICNLSRSKPDFFLGENGRHIEADLSDPSALEKASAQLEEVLGAAPEGELLLINNSGFGDYGLLSDLSAEKQLRMVDLNVRAILDLSMRLLPALEQRGGAVMNIASTAAFQPTPFLATYGATKSFVLHWTLALNEEWRETNMRAVAICPGPTRSNFFKSAGFETPPMQGGVNGFLDMTAEQVADLSLSGLVGGKSLVVTGWKNRLIASFGGVVSKRLSTRIGGAILRKLRLEAHKR